MLCLCKRQSDIIERFVSEIPDSYDRIDLETFVQDVSPYCVRPYRSRSAKFTKSQTRIMYLRMSEDRFHVANKFYLSFL